MRVGGINERSAIPIYNRRSQFFRLIGLDKGCDVNLSGYIHFEILSMERIMISVKQLRRTFGPIVAVDNISFEVEKGMTLGIIGESGCGKTVTCRSILRLIRNAKTSGEIIYKNQNIMNLSEKELRNIRGKEIAMIFQNPTSSEKIRYKTVFFQLCTLR